MSKIAACARLIRERITMEEVAARYLPSERIRSRMMRCPFHADRTPSLRLYADHYHCFGCGAHGDALDFVGKLRSIPVMEAARQIDADFRLGLPLDREQTVWERGARPVPRGKLAAHWQARRQREAEIAFNAACSAWERLLENKAAYAPKHMDEPYHPLYAEALMREGEAEYAMKEAWSRRNKVRETGG